MTIRIEGLEFSAILGLLDFERVEPQRIVVDAVAEYTYKEGGYVDYAEVARLIEETIREGRFELAEDALEALFARISKKFPRIETLHLRLCKPEILPNCRVCVEDFRRFL